ncbi:PBECR2 nuclease fold domain-containing protein [Thiomicrorhabdus indica]|uniref:PBECR2 nuclease fold domain-containing protein n=1 Tax=Thiomicrorhabdus indica TaxID=2267253 RepID=UPI002AA8E429|nr:PBECR2 nuclease fold domain-containing protein [Thiomicrorhabdus indica]
MPQNAQYGSIQFQEKIDFFKNKLRLPTATWTDIWQQQHAKAFVVAGAMKDDLLADFQAAIAKGISGESTLEDFRQDFDAIVKKHGWSYNGGRNWRTRVIYDTNLRTAYAAGRYQQMQQLKHSRPYWQYKHSIAVTDAREEHLSWDGMVLKADDPWWDIHYPPNGWGCQCYVRTLSERDLQRKGLTVSEAPETVWSEQTVGVRTNPRTVKVAEGVDAGFAYNPGKAAWGETMQQRAYDEAKTKFANQKIWQPMIATTWQDYDRPQEIPLKPFELPDGFDVSQGKVQALKALLGGESKVYQIAGHPVLINAEFLADHLKDNRAGYLPMMVQTLEQPYEVWQSFEQHKVNGVVTLRRRIISAYEFQGKSLYIVLTVDKGVLTGWTMVPAKPKQLNKERIGELLEAME